MAEFDIESAVRRLTDEADILYVVNDAEDAVDTKDWARFRTCFDHELEADLSPTGEPPQFLTGEAFTKLVSDGNFPGKKTFHARFNSRVRVDGDRARLEAASYGWNQYSAMTPDMWEVWGQFHYGLRRTDQGWKINYVKQIRYHERGNPAVSTAKDPIEPDHI